MRTSKPVLLLAITALLASLLVSVAAGPAQASGRYVVTATVSTVNAEVGRPLTFHGKVTPNAKGKKVALQVLQPGATHWATLKSAKLDKHSRYVVAVKPTAAGATSYRVVKAAGAGHGSGVSPVRAVTTWRWRGFATLPVIPFIGNVGTTSQASVNLHGQIFAPAIIQEPEGTRLYDLSGRCSRLEAWVSGDPTSADDDSENGWLTGAGQANPGSYTQVIASNSVHRDGDPAHIVRGPSVMNQVWSLQIYSNGVSAGNKVAWGDPRVYCKF